MSICERSARSRRAIKRAHRDHETAAGQSRRHAGRQPADAAGGSDGESQREQPSDTEGDLDAEATPGSIVEDQDAQEDEDDPAGD